MKTIVLDLRGGKSPPQDLLERLATLCTDGVHEWVSLVDSFEHVESFISRVPQNCKMTYGFYWGLPQIERELEMADEIITV